MKIIKTSALTIALSASLCAMTPSASHAQWPGVIEAKAIAEEGFIYGLPIVMNYAVMNEYAVNKNSGQGAVQPDQQRGTGLYLQGHGHHHSQQRHALFPCLAGFAGRADRPFGAGCGKGKSTSILLTDSVALVDFAREVRIALSEFNHYA